MRSNRPYGGGDTLLTRSASKVSNTGGIYASQGCTRASAIGGNQPIGPQTDWTAAVPAMNDQAMRDFLPDGLPSAVRSAAMLHSSVLSAYLQGVQQQQEQQQLLDHQMLTSASANSTAADPVVPPPHPGSYGAVGFSPQHTKCQGSSSRSVDICNDMPQLCSAGPATPLFNTADSIVSSPLPAATAPAAGSAPAAASTGAIGSGRAPAALGSFVGTNSSKQTMPLIEYMECTLMHYVQQQLSPDELAEADSASQESLRQWIRQLMRADSLQTYQDVYVWLNKHLTGLQIRTEVGANINKYKGVAYLDPRTPAEIKHKPTAAASTAAASTAAAQPPSPPPQAAAAEATRISCEQHLLQKYNTGLQRPELPCVGVKLGTQACQEQELKLTEQFIHYPLELCSVLLAQSGEPKRGHPCEPWPEIVIEGVSTSSGAAHKACIPPWVAEELDRAHRNSVHAAAAREAAATAAPTDVDPAALTTAPASSSVWVSVVPSTSQQSGPQLHQDGATSSTNPQHRSPVVTLAAPAAVALPSARYGSTALALPEAYGIAAPTTQQPAVVDEGSALVFTNTHSSNDSTNSSRCSTPDRQTNTRVGADHDASCSKQQVSDRPGYSITTGSSSKAAKPLSDIAEEFLKCNYPEAAAHCQLLHTEALQSQEHQEKYVALHQTLVGLKVRVHFGNSVRNTRDLKNGIAYLDPRQPRDIMHPNHDQVVVRSAEGTESTPQLISVQDYLFHKHDVTLQQPDWPCIGHQRSLSTCKDTPDQQNWFMTYPLELCSARVKDNGELRRGPTFPWESVPIHAISTLDTGSTATAPLPPWIAELLNKKDMQHTTAVGPMHTRQHTQHFAADELQPVGLTTTATPQRVPGAAGLYSLSHSAPAGPISSATDATEHFTAVDAHGSVDAAANESAGQQPHSGDDPSSRSEQFEHGGRVSAPPSVMDPSAAGIIMAAFLQQLQLIAVPWTQDTASASRASKQPQAGTAVLAANPAASMASRPSSSASNTTPATVSDWTQGIDSISCTTQSSSSSSNNSTRPSLQPSSKKGCNSSNSQVHVGLGSLLRQLLPTQKQKDAKAVAVDAVCKAVQFGISETLKMEWQIVEVHQAGSFAKGTSLRGSSDLDILAKIKCHNHAPFHRCRKKFLGAVTRHLCRPPGSPDLKFDCGWQLRDCHSRYFVKLEHPELNLQLDIQVAEYFGPKPQQKEQLLTPLLNSVRQQEEAADASGVRRDSRPPSAAASIAGKGGRDMHSDRQRVTNLTELMTDVVKKVEQRSHDAHNVHGMGRLCTDIIRLMKAWSKHGLPKALAATSSAPGQTSLSADASKGPPGYIWEIFVVYVLEQGLERGKRYHQAHPLELLLDVLSSASERLRSSMPKPEAIILEIFYTYEQAMQFCEEWGDDGCPYAPYVISPVDPTYNCTENAAFRDYDALADAAGSLLKSLQTAVASHKADGWQWLCENSMLGPMAAAYPLGLLGLRMVLA